MHDDEKKTQDQATQESASHEAATQEATLDAELADLDLTVETVEERISPSETNVFDK